MSKFSAFSVIGGDLRQIEVARRLRKDGYEVLTFGFDDFEGSAPPGHCRDLADAVSSDCIVLPLPASDDGRMVHTPLSKRPLELSELFSFLCPPQIVIGGKISDAVRDAAHEAGIDVFDYLEREEMAVENAVPTAEGAVGIAMAELPVTICGSRTLVMGYGRIGRVLGPMLRGLGSDVSVTARRQSDLAWIRAAGLTPVTYGKLAEALPDFDAIFNTVPKRLLGRERLSRLRRDCLVIDLASKPGGVDFEAASGLGLRVVWALSLPGKTAPVTAGAIVKNTIINIVSELEERI